MFCFFLVHMHMGCYLCVDNLPSARVPACFSGAPSVAPNWSSKEPKANLILPFSTQVTGPNNHQTNTYNSPFGSRHELDEVRWPFYWSLRQRNETISDHCRPYVFGCSEALLQTILPNKVEFSLLKNQEHFKKIHNSAFQMIGLRVTHFT